MRNLSWKLFSELAGRRMDFRHYHYFGDVWVPRNLKQGDIIRADLPTDFDKKGKFEICQRNCLVLGLDIGVESMQLEAIRVMRLSYSNNDYSSDYEPLLDPNDPMFRLKLPGIKRQAVLRTGRVEILKPDSAHFGFALDKAGSLDPATFPVIREGIARGYEKMRSRHGSATPASAGLENTMFVSGLDPADWDNSDVFRLKEVALEHDRGMSLNFRQLDEDVRFALQGSMQQHLPEIILGSQYQRYIEIGQTRQLSREEKDSMRANRKINKILSIGYSASKVSKKEMRDLVVKATKEFAEDRVELSVFDIDTRKGSLALIPDLKLLLEDKFGLNENDNAREKLSVTFAQSIDPNSLKDLETLGIGGLVREPTIELPKQLWKGRYLMMRIPSLVEPDEMAQSVYRPCAIWKAYAKKDEDGNPVLAGLELHPCTRGSAHLYSYKMKVRPLDTTVGMPSFLIADLKIRAPISAEYFQPIQPGQGLFYELLPHMVEAFEEKRLLADSAGEGIQTYGLQEIPKDWVEISLPEPPNERLREYLGNARNRMRFVGHPQVRVV